MNALIEVVKYDKPGMLDAGYTLLDGLYDRKLVSQPIFQSGVANLKTAVNHQLPTQVRITESGLNVVFFRFSNPTTSGIR